MATKNDKKRYLLIDGNALVHRGFHAVPLLSTKDGLYTNAVYGFTTILLKAIKDLKPTHIACCFDLAGPTFRHEEYEDYKGTRTKAADELYQQFPLVKEVVSALNIPIFELSGFEADDLLGTLSVKICEANDHNCDVMIATGDLDSLQLVNKCVKIYTLRKSIADTTIYDEKAIKERYGLLPKQMIDYKALRGDPSDNIKGVKGIGEKTAGELIQEFGSIEALYNAIKSQSKKVEEKIKPRVVKLLTDGEDDARLSYRLSKIVLDVPIEIDIKSYKFVTTNFDKTVDLFKKLEFKSLLDKLPKNYVDSEDSKNDITKSEDQIMSQNIGEQNYQLIDTSEKLNKILPNLKKQKYLVVDTETDQLNPMVANVIGISISYQKGLAYYIIQELLSNKDLQNILSDSQIKKIGQNIKYDYLTLENREIKLSPVWFDTMLASYLLNAGTRQHGLDTMAFNILGYQMQSIEELIGKGRNQISMSEVPVEKVSWYASEDADITFRLYEILSDQLQSEKLDKVFFDIEMPLILVLAKMERAGIGVDVKLLNDLSVKAEKQIAKLESSIYKHAGQEFNISSPKQLQVILYENLNLTSGKKNKTGLSTAAGELERLRDEHPIVSDILEYRELTKLKSTYLDALPSMVNSSTGRIHTNYNQTIAATGRLSSTDPNLQNIPIRGQGLGSEVRKAFVAKSGYKLVSLDYSQIELRIAAHLSGDKTMAETFKKNEDIHTATASMVFGVKPELVTADMRRDAKMVNFGVLYGLSSFGLSDRLVSMSQGSAQDFINKYFGAFPDVQTYLEKVKLEVRENAAVTNMLGRIRKFPEIKSSQYFILQAAERAAINFPIQSLSADIIKLAMLEIYKELDGQEEIQMLLQVHDELVFEIKSDKVDKWIKKIKPIMENSLKLSVPIVVEAKVGDNWGDMEKVSF